MSEDELIACWRATVGDTFESAVSLTLLSVRVTFPYRPIALIIYAPQGNYIATPSVASDVPSQLLTYFPRSSLPIDAPARFADLFITRSRWKADEIIPFLSDIAVDSKARDKMLLKFARATIDPQGTWYTARATYNG
jgi:sister chromatid cohesion protein DCC1